MHFQPNTMLMCANVPFSTVQILKKMLKDARKQLFANKSAKSKPDLNIL
jgi:hypothetical protein